jgi:hypothetical protein
MEAYMFKKLCLVLALMGPMTALAMEEKVSLDSNISTTKNQNQINLNKKDIQEDINDNLSSSTQSPPPPAPQQQVQVEEEDDEDAFFGILLFIIPYLLSEWK